ncbi:MAG: sensor histidine kinase, partial [Gammaproteobacteria bacterium]
AATRASGASAETAPIGMIFLHRSDIVIGNLLKNAVKHTDRNRVSVHVAQRAVVIEDYGPGIDAALQASMFERYARGEAADAGGSGIGLALVRRFCDQYGWRIEVRSAPQIGTRIEVRF